MQKKVVGVNQSKRELEKGNVDYVYIAEDASLDVTNELIKLCENNNIDITYINSMKELGKMCNVKVKVAAASILKVEEVSKCSQ